MDGLSAAATVIQLAQVAAQAAIALSQYIAAVKGAESSRTKLVDQIVLISAAANAVESVVQSYPPSLRTPEQQALLKEWFRSDGRAARCKKELEDLVTWLQGQLGSNGNRRRGWIKRMVWPVEENKINAAIRSIEGHMPYFNTIVLLDNANLNQAIAQGLSREREQTRNNDTATTKRELLNWFDGVDCTVKHESTRELRQRTTGEWVFKEQLYIDWRKLSAKFLWLGGKAGAGKSVLASGVIEDVLSGLADDEILAYFYCDFRNPRCTNTMEVLRSLTAQLLWNSQSEWLPSFSELIVRKQRGAGPPADIGTLSNLLKRAAGLYKRPMIVIDALDECDDLSKLLREIEKLYLDGHCRLFVTSRTLHSINRAFANFPSISLDDRVDAVRDDMHFHIRTELESRDRLKTLAHDLKEDIKSVLMKRADGMFRWVQCQLDRLNGCWSLGDVHAVLDTLPATLNETYERMLQSIAKQEFGGRVAQRALIWLVTALAPLRLSQLAEAVTTSRDNPDLDTTIGPMHETDILEICGSLVSFDKRTKSVTLSHYSVKEYLSSDCNTNKTYFVDRPHASLQLASVSIHSILLFVNQPDLDKNKVYLCQYAMGHGFEHLANCVPEHNDPLLALLITLQNHISMHRQSYIRGWRFEEWITRRSQLALYIIIRFGHASMLQHYLDHHSVQVTEGDNPLVYAALYSDVPRVQMLLDRGLDVNIEARVPGTPFVPACTMPPLIAATHNRTSEYQEELFELLLAQECTVPSNVIHSVLRNRNGLCKPSIIRILLEHGADSALLGAGGNNCLHTLLQNWSRRDNSNLIPSESDDLLELVHLLLGAGCDPALSNDEGISPFQLVIRSGILPLVRCLIEKGFRLPLDAILDVPQGFVTDMWLPMLQTLIENGAAVDVWDDDGCNALHHLLRRRDQWLRSYETPEAAFKILLAAGCDINRQSRVGRTPIHVAAQRHTLRVVEFLIDQGAKLPADIVNHAARARMDRMTLLVRLVKTHGASCQALTVGGNNAFHCLLESERLFEREPMEEFLFLLENGCDFCALNSSGVTPLGTAIVNGYLSIARNSLARVARPHADITGSNSSDVEGNSLLHRLCYKIQYRSMSDNEFMERANLLQEAGYDLKRHVNTPNNQGITPFCIAATSERRRPATVSYLLDAGAKFSAVNSLFLNNLQWASHLPWHRDATEAYERALANPTITFSDVARVCYLLTNRWKLPLPIATVIVDMAEYWACTKVIRSNIRYTSHSGEPIAFPVAPNESWMPRRVTFAYKLSVDIDIPRSDVSLFQLLIKRQNGVYAWPDTLEAWMPVPDDPTRTVFGVWDDRAVAIQLNRKHRLAVGDLQSGDALSMELYQLHPHWHVEELELEFFQIDMYFTMRSRGPRTPLESG